MDPVLMGLAAFGAFGGGVAVLVAYGEVRRWKGSAEELGLSWNRLVGGLSGELDGYRIERAHYGENGTRTIVDLPFTFPGRVQKRTALVAMGALVRGPDLKLDSALDDELDVRGPDDLGPVLTAPEVHAALKEMVVRGDSFDLNGSRFIVVEYSRDPEAAARRIREILALLEHVRAGIDAPWAALLDREGLTGEPRRVSGEVDGVRLDIHEREEFGGNTLVVTAQLTRPLPDGAIVVHPSNGRGEGAPIADPILSGRVHVTGPPELVERLSTDDVRGHLLEILMEHRGSRLAEGAIEVVLPAPLDPGPTVDRVLELERALR